MVGAYQHTDNVRYYQADKAYHTCSIHYKAYDKRAYKQINLSVNM